MTVQVTLMTVQSVHRSLTVLKIVHVLNFFHKLNPGHDKVYYSYHYSFFNISKSEILEKISNLKKLKSRICLKSENLMG